MKTSIKAIVFSFLIIIFLSIKSWSQNLKHYDNFSWSLNEENEEKIENKNKDKSYPGAIDEGKLKVQQELIRPHRTINLYQIHKQTLQKYSE